MALALAILAIILIACGVLKLLAGAVVFGLILVLVGLVVAGGSGYPYRGPRA